MKALLLAAGIGSRLSPITDNRPKSLVSVHGKPILTKQIENLIANGVDDITIVAGYKAQMIEESTRSFPGVKVILSRDYLQTNNMYSAYLARSAMQGETFLMMNSDVFFDASVIETLLHFDAPDAIVTDVGVYMDESMKVTVRDGKVTEIAKTISKADAFGTSIDVYKFSAQGGKAFFEKCAEYIEQKQELKKWSGVALNDILADVPFAVCPLRGRWYEIDDHKDLAAAEKLFASEAPTGAAD